MSTPPPCPPCSEETPGPKETKLPAIGATVETQSISIHFFALDESDKSALFPKIRKQFGDGSVTELGLTPAEAAFIKANL